MRYQASNESITALRWQERVGEPAPLDVKARYEIVARGSIIDANLA